MDSPILFEPWSLGDAVIAARIARGRTGAAVHIASRWAETVHALFPGLPVRTIDLPYTQKGRGWRGLKGVLKTLVPDRDFQGWVIGVRGDLRDRWVARRLYPKARLRWFRYEAFLARRWRLLNLPFRLGLAPVQNRYARWARALYTDLPSSSAASPPDPVRRILIHAGAQWLSRRYPWTVRLRDLLRSEGFHVDLAVGPGDPPIDGASAQGALCLEGRHLVEFIRSSTDMVMANDSAAMHIAAAAGKPVAVFSAVSDIREWVPPGWVLVLERRPHHGYIPRRYYMTDRLLTDGGYWHEPEQVVTILRSSKWIH